MTYQIIPISEKYIEGYCAAVDSVSKERKYLSFLEGPSLESSREFVQENLKEGWPHFIALIDNTVVGWCDITSYSQPIYAHCGVLGIGVVTKHRGIGIGEALMHHAINQAKSIGFTRIELTVREENKAAITLYQKYGFVIEGVKHKAVRMDGKYENVVCMALLFE